MDIKERAAEALRLCGLTEEEIQGRLNGTNNSEEALSKLLDEVMGASGDWQTAQPVRRPRPRARRPPRRPRKQDREEDQKEPHPVASLQPPPESNRPPKSRPDKRKRLPKPLPKSSNTEQLECAAENDNSNTSKDKARSKTPAASPASVNSHWKRKGKDEGSAPEAVTRKARPTSIEHIKTKPNSYNLVAPEQGKSGVSVPEQTKLNTPAVAQSQKPEQPSQQPKQQINRNEPLIEAVATSCPQVAESQPAETPAGFHSHVGFPAVTMPDHIPMMGMGGVPYLPQYGYTGQVCPDYARAAHWYHYQWAQMQAWYNPYYQMQYGGEYARSKYFSQAEASQVPPANIEGGVQRHSNVDTPAPEV